MGGCAQQGGERGRGPIGFSPRSEVRQAHSDGRCGRLATSTDTQFPIDRTGVVHDILGDKPRRLAISLLLIPSLKSLSTSFSRPVSCVVPGCLLDAASRRTGRFVSKTSAQASPAPARTCSWNTSLPRSASSLERLSACVSSSRAPKAAARTGRIAARESWTLRSQLRVTELREHRDRCHQRKAHGEGIRPTDKGNSAQDQRGGRLRVTPPRCICGQVPKQPRLRMSVP